MSLMPPALDPTELGKILVLQSSLHAVPNEQRLAEAVTHSLSTLPGVKRCSLHWDDQIVSEDQEPEIRHFSINTIQHRYGTLVVALSDPDAFSLYAPYVSNTANLISLYIENLRMTSELNALNRKLESEVAKQTEELRQSEERFKILFEHTSACIVFTQNRTFQYMNQAMLDTFGYTREELYGRDTSLIHLSQEKFIEAGSVFYASLKDHGSWQGEWPFRKKNGEILWMDIYISLLPEGGIVSVLHDCTARKQAQEALRVSEEKYKALFEQTGDYLLLLEVQPDDAPIITEANEMALTKHGYTREEMIGMSIMELDVGMSLEQAIELCQRSLMGEVILEETQHRCKDGSIFPVEISLRLVRINDESSYILSVERDITDRKKAEEELAQQRYYLKKAQEIGRIGTWDMDVQNNILRWTDENYEIFGLPMGTDLTYETFVQCVHPDDRDYVDRAWKTALVSHKPYDIQHRLVVNGATIWVREKAELEFDAEGKCIRAIGFTQDITDRVQAEVALRENVAKQREMFANIGDVVVIIDQDGINRYKSPNIERWFGWKPEEVVGNNTWENVHPDDVSAAQKFIASLLKKPNTSGTTKCRYRCKDGCYKWIEFTGVNLLHNPDIRGILGNYHDITERMQMDDELLKARKLESISLLAGGIAHDFNNLLQAILGNISLAKVLHHSPSELAECLDEAEIASTRAKNLTQQLLTFSKGGSPVKESANVFDLVKETTAFSLRGSNVSCTYQFPENLWFVDVDKGQFSQVIQNLVINADQAMPAGGHIQIKAENIRISNIEELQSSALQNGPYVKLSITDQGQGIPAQFLEKIFDPYFTTKQKGSGLGLATTYSILKKHHGMITVESTIGVGTTFTLYLPASSRVTDVEPDEIVNNIVTGQGRILVVDDEEMVRTIASRMLTAIGYQVDCVADGREAIAIYKQTKETKNPYKAVIMDLTIPGGMGGKEATRQLLDYDPNARVIVSSGYSNDPVMANYTEYGFSGVISKPYQFKDLGKKIQNILRNRV